MSISIIRPAAAWARLGHKSTTGYERIKQGLLPPPIPLGPERGGRPSMVGFIEAEIEAINAARVAGASDDEIRHIVARLIANRRASRALSYIEANCIESGYFGAA